MAFKASSRHGYGPFLLGLLAAAAVLLGKFRWESSPTMYGAVGLLVIASLWNAWPIRGEPSKRTSAITANHKELIELKYKS
jgi:hypothetical protein